MMTLIKSLIINEKNAESPSIVSVSVIGIATRLGIPIVTSIVPIIKLVIMVSVRILLGMDL